MDKQTYRIDEGVRRAKAAWLCGHETIAARIDGLGEIIQVPIAALLSPKTRIEDNGPRGGSWGTIYRATQRGAVLPPIIINLVIINPGTNGIPIADVEVEADELELFRQRYSGAP